jgi:MFS family permease
MPSNFRFGVFLGGQICSLIGDGLATLAIPLLVLQITSSPLAAAFATTPRIVGVLLLGLPSGAVIDRLNPRGVMLAMDALRACVFLLLAACAAAHVLTLAIILGLAFLAAGGGVCFDTALTVLVQDIVAANRLVRANAYLEGSRQASLVVGPGIVGVLAVMGGLELALVVNAATFLISFATVRFLPNPQKLSHTPSRLVTALGRLCSDFIEGARYLRSSRVILVVTCLQAAANFFIAVEGLLVFYVKDAIHLGDGAVGAVVGAGGIGGIIGAVVASRLGRAERQNSLIAGGVVVLGMALSGIGLTTNFVLLMTLNLFVGASSVTAVVIVRAQRQRIVPRNVLGRVSATARVVALSAYPVGALVVGALTTANRGDPRPVFVWSGLFAVCVTAVAWFAGMRASPDSLAGLSDGLVTAAQRGGEVSGPSISRDSAD